MTAETALLRLATVIPASLGAWAAVATLLPLFRVRDASLRAACHTWAAVASLTVLAGVPGGGFLLLRVVVPADHPLLGDGGLAAPALGLWTLVAAALVVRRALRDTRLLACADGVATAFTVPEDVADAVARGARWLGVAPPRIAAAECDGTAFVAGVRNPVVFIPLGLWRRLDLAGRRAMVLHELAHVRRRDPLRLRAVALVADLFWPAVPLRWIAARLRESWEAQADEEALIAGASRSGLARSLVAASGSPRAHGVLAFGDDSAATLRRMASLRRRPRGVTLALQTAALACLVPWFPAREDQGVTLRMERHGDSGRRGVVTVGLGSGGSPVSAVSRGLGPCR